MNPIDLAENLASIREGKKHCNFLLATIHTHEPGNWSQQPPDFLIDLAHQSIDAGADEFAGHGPHQLRGIEIYKGKPIFYSLGNFIFENETMQFQPAESFDSLNLPSDATAADYFDARSHNDTRGFPVEKAVWESVIAQVSFNADHSLGSITLIPISLGFQESRSERGRPRLAYGDQAKQLIDTVAKLSAPYGTNVVFSAGHGTVVADATQK
jgi:poly-gamma-glutamate synthesis protein (capsule biosynthesis protein)